MMWRQAATIALAALAAVTTSYGAQAVELTYGSWPPAPAYQNRVALPTIFKAIEAETKGEVKWKLVPGGQLAGPKESFQATSDGIIQGALGISSYIPNLVPSLNTIYTTIVFGSDSVPASAAALETYTLDCPSCLAEFKKINIVPLAGWTTSNYYLVCREPIAKLEDLKGKRVRGTGGNADLWQAAGAVPVAATLPEAVSLLQRGGLDCQHGVHSWLQTFGYADFAKNLLDYPLGLSGPAVGLMFNRDAWSKLTLDQKKIHLKQAAYLSAAEAIGEFQIDNDAHLKKVIAEKGVKMIKAEPSGFKALTDKFEKIQRQSVIDAAKGFGVPNPEKIVDAYHKNLVKWTGLTKNVNRDIDKFADLIWTEIYSKVDPAKL